MIVKGVKDLSKSKKKMCMTVKPIKFLKGVDEGCFLVCLFSTNLLLHAN